MLLLIAAPAHTWTIQIFVSIVQSVHELRIYGRRQREYLIGHRSVFPPIPVALCLKCFPVDSLSTYLFGQIEDEDCQLHLIYNLSVSLRAN